MHFVPEERLPHHGPFPTSWRPTCVSRDEKIYTLRFHGCWSLLVTIDFWWWTLLYNLRRAVAVDCSSFRRRALPRPRRDQTPLRLNGHPPCRHPPIRSSRSAHRHPGTSGPLHPCRICRACTRMPFSWTFLVRGRIGCRVTARGDEVQKREPQRARPGASGGFAHVFWHMCVAVCGAGKFTFCWRGRACCMYLRAGVLACWRAGVSFACPSSCGTHCGLWWLFWRPRGWFSWFYGRDATPSRASSRATLKRGGSLD